MFKTILRSLLIGIGVGVLLAPRSGAETRRLLSEKLGHLMDSTGNMVEDLSERASVAADDMSKRASADTDEWVPKQHSMDAGTGQPSTVSDAEPRPM